MKFKRAYGWETPRHLSIEEVINYKVDEPDCTITSSVEQRLINLHEVVNLIAMNLATMDQKWLAEMLGFEEDKEAYER
ncbi:hypothetical protein [Methylotenera sp.]|uniref:hypothetical protein n=1 Tax=Methylotenera sp. TaxID=2051956 RepID=UPI0024874757|nr:hypothetical protein [Methylotenera sp.]MDI1362563.1 hypothetical protein [Methylotenera sp.]